MTTDTETGVARMEALIVLSLIGAALAMLGLASLAWGVDSRDLLPDDHRR